MNVRIFWVRAMKCMCAQTRPRFILSSEGVLGGMEFEPMLTPREKSPLPENVPRGGSNPRHCGSDPKHYQLSYSGPRKGNVLLYWCMMMYWCINILRFAQDCRYFRKEQRNVTWESALVCRASWRTMDVVIFTLMHKENGEVRQTIAPSGPI